MCMTSRTDKMSAGNSHDSYMREYKKRKRLEESNCNIHKRTKLHAERQHEYREAHKNFLLNTCIITENAKLKKYKSQFHYVFSVIPGNQGSPITFYAHFFPLAQTRFLSLTHFLGSNDNLPSNLPI
jgi:hypothetical protein